MFRKFALISILTLLAGCETFVGMERDLDNLVKMSGLEDDIFSFPEGKATKAPKALPSTMNMRTGIVIQSEQDKADAAAKKATAKPLNATKKAPIKKIAQKKAKIVQKTRKITTSKNVTEKSVPEKTISKPIQKNPSCPSDHFDRIENFSQFYAFYYKKPKICKAKDYYDRAMDIYRLILIGKDHQDIRLLNADHGFANFTTDVMRYAPTHIRKNGASFLRSSGCGLISSKNCKIFVNLN